MYTNHSLYDRILKLPSMNDPDVILFQKLVSLIEEYNIIAADKNLPLKSVPVYNNQINRDLLYRIIASIVKEINYAKSIKTSDNADSPPPVRTGKYNDTFPAIGGNFTIKSWIYFVKEDNGTKYLSVKAADKTITKVPSDPPYNYIEDSNGTTLTVTSMFEIFRYISLSDISALANWNVSTITDMGYMFIENRNLSDISALANWDTSNVTNMMYMFNATKISSVDALAKWDTGNVKNMQSLFSECKNISDISALANWDVSNVNTMNFMFKQTGISDASHIAGWNVSNVQFMQATFSECSNLTNINGFSEWDIDNAKNVYNMFYGCDLNEAIINASVDNNVADLKAALDAYAQPRSMN